MSKRKIVSKSYPDAAEIVVILDRSGSMNTIASDAIGGFNQFLKEQKAIDSPATMTLVQFDDRYDIVHDNVPLGYVPLLNKDTFVPRGMTALNDAIGRTINNIRNRNRNSSICPACTVTTKTIVAILTDGLENCSREFNTHKINEMISHMRDEHNWEFIFLAANQDAFATGNLYGIKSSDTFNFAADAIGTIHAYKNMNISTSLYRAEVAKKDDD